ncbi:hypothetical protein Daus18300_009038 [Diaporthe australafricana]|uniref:6-phosphogluconate dehydrogenase n=1 Tax=Diaporthe australafricana TaxID=127596 RepID=A0ABR3WFR6_9PEZI
MAPVVMWIGAGKIGGNACKSLVSHGSLTSPLILFNRTAQKCYDLASALPSGSTEIVTSLREGITRADIVFSCLSNDTAVEATYQAIISETTADNAHSLRGKLFIGLETVHPDTANKIAHLLTSHGAEFVACPVLGPPAAAAAGQLIAFPSGPASSISRATPYLTGGEDFPPRHGGRGVLSRAMIAFPDQPCGAGLKMKIIANTFTLNAACQLAEAFTLAEKASVDPALVGQFVDVCLVRSSEGGPHGTNPFHVYARRMLSGDYFRKPPAGAVALGIKDMGHALRLAEETGATVRNPLVALGWCRDVLERDGPGGGELNGDVAGMYGVVREKAGLRFENDG